jgi:hypothetical protein
MPSRLTRVLCYGQDRVLQLTRRWILEREFSVTLCENLWELAHAMQEGPVNALLVCDSVPAQQAREAARLLRAGYPAAKLVRLEPSRAQACDLPADARIAGLDGPPALLRQLHTLLDPLFLDDSILDISILDTSIAPLQAQDTKKPVTAPSPIPINRRLRPALHSA